MMLDCLIIGAGQYGLRCASLLQVAGAKYQVVDCASRVGDAWRNRPVNLTLFTSRQVCTIGQRPMRGDPNGFPAASEFADYLENFAMDCQLHIRLNCQVVRLTCAENIYTALLDDGSSIQSLNVINAAGAHQLAVVPEIAQFLGGSVQQLTAASYRDNGSVAAHETVLVAGDGASGRQIALELSRTNKVLLSTGRKRTLVANVVLGRDLFWWLSKIRILYAPSNSIVGKILRKRDPIPAKNENNDVLAKAGVIIKPRITCASADEVKFSDGSGARVDAVIWCVGYKDDLSWIDLPGIPKDADAIKHQHGKTARPGFYLVGRKWLTCRASDLIPGVEKDAGLITGHILKALPAQRARLSSESC